MAVGNSKLYDPEEIAESHVLNNLNIMDFGCGAGRLLVGLQRSGVCFSSYTGVDIGAKEVAWLSETYTDRSKHEFVLLNVHNERYNKKGEVLDPVQGLGLDKAKHGSIDLIVSRSVFSHMKASDIKNHLVALRDFLNPKTGLFYVSLFVSEDMDSDEMENPNGESTPLHVVVLKKSYFEQTVEEAGYHILLFTTIDGQQTYLLSPRARARAKAADIPM